MNKLESALTLIIIIILCVLIADISPYDDFNEKAKEYLEKISVLENEIRVLQGDIEKANEILAYQKSVMMEKHFWFIIDNNKMLGGLYE